MIYTEEEFKQVGLDPVNTVPELEPNPNPHPIWVQVTGPLLTPELKLEGTNPDPDHHKQCFCTTNIIVNIQVYV